MKFPIHSATLGFGISSVTAAVADCNMLLYLLQTYVPLLRHDAAEAVKAISTRALAAVPEREAASGQAPRVTLTRN